MCPKFCKYRVSCVLFCKPGRKTLAFAASRVAGMWRRMDLWPKTDQSGELAQTLNQEKQQQWRIHSVRGGSSSGSSKSPRQQWQSCGRVPAAEAVASTCSSSSGSRSAATRRTVGCDFAAEPLSFLQDAWWFFELPDVLSTNTCCWNCPWSLVSSIKTLCPIRRESSGEGEKRI